MALKIKRKDAYIEKKTADIEKTTNKVVRNRGV